MPELSRTINATWKQAEVNPLLKEPSADLTDLKNYRPISLLPFAAKVSEKFINTQLTTFIEENAIFDFPIRIPQQP